MAERQWDIGICGTFDLANYGDLLFPLIAESELAERLGPTTLHRFSYHARTPPEWPYEVTSVAALPGMIHRLDGLLIGGGFVIRFDKDVAPGYFPPKPGIHHPTGYWLTPALMALQNDVPLVWNAPGMHCNEIPSWAKPLLEMTLTLSRYVSVRDEESRSALEHLTAAPIAVVPDTAFALPRLVNLDGPPSAAFTRITEASGLNRPYIVLQATLGMEGIIRFLKNHTERFRDFQFLALPIGPVLGERHEIIDADLPGVVRLPNWPSPLILAELVGRSQAVVGHSYHLFITALTSGVPVFTRQNLSTGKYSTMRCFESIFSLPADGEPDVEWFLARVGKKTPGPSAGSAGLPLRRHWDRVAAALQAESSPTAPALNRFWQQLPTCLEAGEARGNNTNTSLAQECATAQARLKEAQEHLAAAQTNAAESRNRLDETREQFARQASLNDLTKQRMANRLDEIQGQLVAASRDAQARRTCLDALTKQFQASRAETLVRDARITDLMASWSWRLTAPLRFLGRPLLKNRTRTMMNLKRIRRHRLETTPFEWAEIRDLFDPDAATRLATTYPCDHFKLVAAQGGEKDYEYEARSLIGMGANTASYPEDLSDAWRGLATDLLSPEYRAAMTVLTGRDLTHAPMEVNIFHYGPGASLGAHRDLPEKLVTHVLYFNRSWNPADGGCLSILRSADPTDLVAEIPPLVGYSSVIVRSENSWHAVSRVVSESPSSRRSVTVTFYRPGSVSSMWPANDPAPLHHYQAPDLQLG